MDKKRILCFGDSNTFGYNPVSGGRYDDEHRWPEVMAKALGEGYDVVSEGLNGRTAVIRNPEEPYLCGLDYFLPCVLSHRPLAKLIIMLGTNDSCYNVSAEDICSHIERLAGIAGQLPVWRDDAPPTKGIIIAVPAHMRMPEGADSYTRETVQKSIDLAGLYRDMAQRHGYGFFDVNEFAAVGKPDLLHLTPEGNVAIGWAMAEYIGGEG